MVGFVDVAISTSKFHAPHLQNYVLHKNISSSSRNIFNCPISFEFDLGA
jgi:hypothetical protein